MNAMSKTTVSPSRRDNLATGKALARDQIRAIAAAELQASRRNYDSELEHNRSSALRYYKANPADLYYSNCGIDKRQPSDTSAQSTDVSDAVEWLLPAIIKAVAEGPPIRFDAVSPDDEEQAELETAFVHQVLYKDCHGYSTLYSMIKDALLLKNGVVATFWDDQLQSGKETYTDLTEVEVALLLSPDDGSEVELIGKSERMEVVLDPVSEQPLPDPAALQEVQTAYQAALRQAEMMRMPPPPPPDISQLPPQQQTLFDVEIRRVNEKGRVRVMPLPPEDFRVRFDHTSVMLDEAKFCSFSRRRTKGDLIADGYDKDLVATLPLAESPVWDSEEKQERMDVEEEALTTRDSQAYLDAAMDEVEVHQCYLQIDVDGNGILEQVRVDLAGKDGEILLEWDECAENPFSAATPYIKPHGFYGYSLYDKLKNIQDQKTKLMRQLDFNTDLINNPRRLFDEQAGNIHDLLMNRPGQVIRMRNMDGLRMEPTPNLAQNGFMLLEYLDKRRGERTGVDPDMQSMGAIPVGAETAHGIERLLSAKEELVGLIVRTIIETGLRDIYVKIRNLMMRHMDRDQLVKLRNRWYTVNPGNWQERSNTTVNIGLGTGDRHRKLKGLTETAALQLQMIQAGGMGHLITFDKMYNTFAELVRMHGIGEPEDYWLDPDVLKHPETPEGQKANEALQIMRQREAEAAQAAQSQDPVAAAQSEAAMAQAQAAQIKAQADMQKAQMDLQQSEQDREAKMQQFQQDLEFKYAQLAKQLEAKYAEMELRYQADLEKQQQDLMNKAADRTLEQSKQQIDVAKAIAEEERAQQEQNVTADKGETE